MSCNKSHEQHELTPPPTAKIHFSTRCNEFGISGKHSGKYHWNEAFVFKYSKASVGREKLKQRNEAIGSRMFLQREQDEKTVSLDEQKWAFATLTMKRSTQLCS